ncbi:hypothetical protein LPJ75_003360, partial [Coemansia sp. RSA 2598]
MTHINSLPAAILERAFKHSLDAYDLTSWSWQSQLQLLAVCRQWREIAQPHVYGMGFIKLREEFGYDSDCSDSGTDGDESYVVMDTNLGKIAENGRTHWVKNMHIVLLWPLNPLAYIDEVIRKLQAGNSQWPSVAKLTIWLTSSTCDLDTAALKGEPLDSAIIDAARVLSDLLPSVVRLNIRAYTLNGLAEIFVSQLTGRCAPQLRTLKCNVPLPLASLHFSDTLAHLDLQFGPETGRLLSQVHAGSLQSIVLSNVPFDFTWRYFVGDGADGKDNVTFHQLETLSLCYAGHLNKHRDAGIIDDPCCLHFPKLKNIIIQGCPEYCEILHAKTYPRKLNSVSIAGPYAAIRALATMDIVSADSLLVSITSVGNQDLVDGFYETANRLYGRLLTSFWSKLVIPRCSQSLDPRQISWTNISELVCRDHIEFNSLVDLIPRLPRAKKLSFAQITFDKAPLD